MNKRKVILMTLAIILIIFAFSFLNSKPEEVESPINIEIGQIFNGIKFERSRYVLNYKIADLNGDSVNDVVILIGEKVEEGLMKNVDVVFYDGNLKEYQACGLKNFEGDSARIDLADLTGDNLLDILLILNTENLEKMIRVVTLEKEQGNLKEIFKAKDNQYIRFTGNFVDGFKVNLNNRKLNISREIDLKNISNNLIENRVFESSGKIIENENRKIKTTGFTEIEFVQLSGCMGIKTKQRIVTIDYKNILEEIDIIWKYEEGKWQIKEAKGVRLGNLLY